MSSKKNCLPVKSAPVKIKASVPFRRRMKSPVVVEVPTVTTQSDGDLAVAKGGAQPSEMPSSSFTQEQHQSKAKSNSRQTAVKSEEEVKPVLKKRKSFHLRMKNRVDIFSPSAVENAHYVCHNVQDCLFVRGFRWPANVKGKGLRAATVILRDGVMYDLFEFKRLLSVAGLSTSASNGELNNSSSDKQIKDENRPSNHLPHLREEDDEDDEEAFLNPSIYRYAFTGPCRRPFLAMALTNGYILFYGLRCPSYELPTVRQLPWYAHHSKRVAALCFDPSSSWLLVNARDATLYILPASAFLSGPMPSDPPWSIDDVTEIKLPGRRAVPTAIVWWKTSHSQPIAIIGNELGEISFVDLELRKEVGGTYITVSITDLELITDDGDGRVFLLITGSNYVQWQLILEQGNGSNNFLLEGIGLNAEKLKPFSGPPSLSPFLSCLSTAEDRRSSLSSATSKENGNDSEHSVDVGSLHPKRLVQFAGITRLRFAERYRAVLLCTMNCSIMCDSIMYLGKLLSELRLFQLATAGIEISGMKKMAQPVNNVVLVPSQLHQPDLKIVPSYVFKLPAKTRHVVLGDHLMFIVTQDNDVGLMLRIVSVDMALSSLDAQGGCYSDYELQFFRWNSCSEILGVNKCRLVSTGGISRFGCLLITTCGLYCLRQKCSSEAMFLQLVLTDGCFTKADRFAKLLGMDIGVLYEKAAETKLVEGHVGAAVQLYQMAKCPHIRCVANLTAHGCLSEVLRYIRVLFAKPTFDFSQTDLKHFSNVALYCYVQQCLKLDGAAGEDIERQHFRVFLFENRHYDEMVAIHLLATYGFYVLLAEYAEQRGLIPHAMNELLPLINRDCDSLFGEESSDQVDDDRQLRPAWADSKMFTFFNDHGFCSLVSLEYNDHFVVCLLQPCLSFFISLNINIAWRHLTLVKRLTEDWITSNIDRLKSLVIIYDPSNPAYAALFRNSSSTTSLDFNDNSDSFFAETGFDSLLCKEPSVAGLAEEITEFFLKLLLHLCMKCRKGSSLFNKDFVIPEMDLTSEELADNSQAARDRIEIMCYRSPLAAGFAHACFVTGGKLFTWGRNLNGCLGRGPVRRDWLMAECVSSLLSPLVNVSSVACGAAHTLILTDCGVYAFGSNRYGQLGVDADMGFVCNQTCYPLLVKSLYSANVRVSAITCGQYHSLALSMEGAVYSWGWGVHGQLGLGHPGNLREPRLVQALLTKSSRIISVSAGYAHSVFLSEKGEVFVCGCGQFGQLGTGHTSKESFPVQIHLPEVIRLVAAGYVHNVAVSVCGKLFTWGCNPQTLRLRAQVARRCRATATSKLSLDQVADNSDVRKPVNPSERGDLESTFGIFSPVQVESGDIASDIVQISCGANHTVLVTRDGEVYSFGRNLDGQLGHECRKEQTVPTMIIKLNNRKVLSASCGGDFTLVLDDSGKVWGFGVDEFGQIGGGMKPSCGSEALPSPSKVHLLRTNMRVVYLKSATRPSILQPVILSYLPGANTSKPFCLEATCTSVQMVTAPCRSILNSSVNGNDFSDCLVHLALQRLHGLYCPGTVEEICLNVRNFQAAAKVALLNGNHSKCFSYNLRAISAGDSQLSMEKQCNNCLTLLSIYLETVFPNGTDILKPILEAAIEFWTENSGSVQQLEDYFINRLPKLLFPLSSIILGNPDLPVATNEKVKIFVNQLSSQFYLRVVSDILTTMKCGSIHPEVADLLAESVSRTLLEKLDLGSDGFQGSEDDKAVDPAAVVCVGKLWDELVQNLWKDASGGVTSSIDLSSDEVKTFLRDVGSGSAEIVLFTCGHHYPKEEFRTTVLPHFEAALQASTASPRNLRMVVSTYETMGFQTMACPKCLLDGFEQEAS